MTATAPSPHLTASEWETLRALIDRIIPADEWPSGWEAGVGAYLGGQFDRDLKSQLPTYRRGLASLNAESQSAHGRDFAHLTDDEKDALLKRVEHADVAVKWTTRPAKFFAMAIQHAGEGFYADAGNGGNFGEVSWKMVGFR